MQRTHIMQELKFLPFPLDQDMMPLHYYICPKRECMQQMQQPVIFDIKHLLMVVFAIWRTFSWGSFFMVEDRKLCWHSDGQAEKTDDNKSMQRT